MQILINGESTTLAPNSTLADLIDTLDLGNRRIAVEINGQIVPRSRHAETQLGDGDSLEIVHAIGGG